MLTSNYIASSLVPRPEKMRAGPVFTVCECMLRGRGLCIPAGGSSLSIMARANVCGNESNDALAIQTTCHTHQLQGRNFIEFHRISYQHGTSMLYIP